MTNEFTQIILYQTGVVVIVLTIAYRLFKGTSSKRELLPTVGFIILTGWLVYFLEIRLPVLVNEQIEENNKYAFDDAAARDWKQEFYPINQLSKAIHDNIPAGTKDPLLIVFPESYVRQLQWDWGLYLNQRIRYRCYPMKMDLAVRDSTGNYCDYYKYFLSKYFVSPPTKPESFSPQFISRYRWVLYVFPEIDRLPDGFQEQNRVDCVLILLAK